MSFTTESVLTIVAALVGLPAIWSLVIDVLKWAGAIADGDAGKWSAAFNLITLLVVAAVIQFYPSVDVTAVDAQLAEIAKFAALAFGYIVQIFGSKAVHGMLATKGWTFSHSSPQG